MTRSLLAFVAALLVTACAAEDPVAGLEDRLFAPCCWRQTLHDHESPLATQLRAEIADRARAGESTASIESDLVKRYGERIRALPEGRDPRLLIGVLVVAVTLCALGGLLLFVRRRRAPAQVAEDAAPSDPPDPKYEDKLDDELALVDV